jgi:ribosomal protein S3
MLTLFKRSKTESKPSIYEVRKNAKEFIVTYVSNKRIDGVLLKNVEVEPKGDSYEVTVVAGFPEKLIGKGGVIANDLSKRLSKYLDLNLKINIVRK